MKNRHIRLNPITTLEFSLFLKRFLFYHLQYAWRVSTHLPPTYHHPHLIHLLYNHRSSLFKSMPRERVIHQPRGWVWVIAPWLVVSLLGFLFAQPPSLGAYYRRQLYLYVRTLVGKSIAICIKVVMFCAFHFYFYLRTLIEISIASCIKAVAFCAFHFYKSASFVWKMLMDWREGDYDEFQFWIWHQCESVRHGLIDWIPPLWKCIRDQWIPWSLRQYRSLTSLLYAGCSFVKEIPKDTVEDFAVSSAMVVPGAIGVSELYKRRDNWHGQAWLKRFLWRRRVSGKAGLEWSSLGWWWFAFSYSGGRSVETMIWSIGGVA